MELHDYLKARGESGASFARRSRTPQTTIGRAVRKEGIPNGLTCARIIQASKDAPAPDGGTVTMDDLVRRDAPEYAACSA